MKINLDTPIISLSGKEVTENGETLTVGQIVANCLDTAGEIGGRMKLYVLAKKCYEGGVVDFDEADLDMLKKVVEKSKISSNVVIGQVLVALSNSPKS